MIEGYVIGASATAAYMLWAHRPRLPGDWLALAGIVAVWPALFVYALYHALFRARGA